MFGYSSRKKTPSWNKRFKQLSSKNCKKNQHPPKTKNILYSHPTILPTCCALSLTPPPPHSPEGIAPKLIHQGRGRIFCPPGQPKAWVRSPAKGKVPVPIDAFLFLGFDFRWSSLVQTRERLFPQCDRRAGHERWK